MRGTARRVLEIVKQSWIKAKASEDEETVKIFLVKKGDRFIVPSFNDLLDFVHKIRSFAVLRTGRQPAVPVGTIYGSINKSVPFSLFNHRSSQA